MTTFVLLGCLTLAGVAQADTINTLVSFPYPSSLYGSLTLSQDGTTLYGTTYEGGANGVGSVFKVSVADNTVTTLASFDNLTGTALHGALTLSQDGTTLYGTTAYGGANGVGTVFSLSTGGGAITTLATFNGSNGRNPFGSLTLNGSTLYGTTAGGGGNDYGSIFSVSTSGGGITTLASFNYNNGAGPDSSLTLVGSTLYGTAWGGGANDAGTVFSVPVAGGAIATLVSFDGNIGRHPNGSLLYNANNGLFYGTTSENGPGKFGTVFSMSQSGEITTLAAFDGPTGANPQSSLTLIGSTLYGTTMGGGANEFGTIFSVPVGGGPITTLATFGANDIAPVEPYSSLTLSMDGTTFYGTTIYGGVDGGGTVFSLGAPAATAAVPEPSLVALSGLGGVLLIGFYRRQRRQA